MSGNEDLGMDASAVKNITVGLRGAIAELREIGTAGGASMGAGFESLSMTGMEAGHPGVADLFEDFCERWEWGVRALIQDASTLASNLGIAAGTVWEEDQYIQGAFKVGVNSLYGNPHANEDDIEKKSWDDITRPPWEVYKPDWSGESFEQMQKDVSENWSQTGETLKSNGQIGSLNDLLQQTAANDGGKG
ncbi:hypothetical protein DEJ50_07640 [Streptomyces venezuelae]|uniref:Uncharacterized protein n=1 Tax=Streptomyces venezuelae TaxID=54571 RepID=A0A5P2CXS7_STRVZ|nr:hypothetical protein [Streptomyces venezuelae]QES47706.1 hypothetical protein DEJ50_07640 [Streptomyces venezuelae]